MQAGLTGQLVLSAFRAGSAAETGGRLLDMGIEPYILRSGLLGVLSQRLVRRLCDCARWSDDPKMGFPKMYVAVLRAGQRSGRLAPALERFAETRARVRHTRRAGVGPCMYPLICPVGHWLQMC